MDRGHRYTFGIEEEFFLVDLRTRNALARMPRRLVKLCRGRLGEAVTWELKQAQIETVTPVLAEADEALPALRRLRRGVAEVAGALGVAPVAAGTHPLAQWRGVAVTAKPRYTRFLETFQHIGRRDLMCGLHVHVAIPEGVDRVQLMNRLMPWLPLFLALSTSSPFWQRQATGLLSYRSIAYDEWPRSGVPDFFEDEAQYDAFAALLARHGALTDASELWWAIRPSLDYPTLELRVADSCTRAEDAAALAVLFRALVRRHVRRPALGAQRSAISRRLIDENRWRAARHGLEAHLIDEPSGEARRVDAILDALLADLAPELDPAETAALRPLRRILALGTSAHVQNGLFAAQRDHGGHQREALQAVVDWLIRETAAESASEPA
jgi:carboxylate-amine ligase